MVKNHRVGPLRLSEGGVSDDFDNHHFLFGMIALALADNDYCETETLYDIQISTVFYLLSLWGFAEIDTLFRK